MVCTARDPPPLWSSLLSSLLSLHFGLHTFSLLSLWTWSPLFSVLSLFSPLSTHFLFFSWRLPIFHYKLFSFLTFYSLLSILCRFCFPFFVAMNTTIVVRFAHLKEENFGVFTFSI